MRTLCWRHFALIVVLLAMTAETSWDHPGHTVMAQGSTSDYTGVDIVFLVDQSGSMGGQTYGSTDHPVANDPNDLRFSGLQQMIERLAGYRINYFHGSPVQFQTAVVYFGSQTRVILPSTLIAPDTMTQWEPLSAKIQPALSAAVFRTNLGNTDHLAALQAAKAILQEMERSWQGGRHIQAILLLTDGESYMDCPQPIPSQSEQPTPTPLPQPEYCRDGKFQPFIYRNLLRNYTAANLPASRYRLYMAAINKDLKELPEFWKTLIGEDRAELVDANSMWAFFEKMLGELTVNEPNLEKTTPGKLEEIQEDRVTIPPYLQEVTFIIHKPAPELRAILSQNGVLLEDLPSTIVQDNDKYIESITIRNPRPGFIDIKRPATTQILRIFMLARGAEARCDELGSAPQFIPLRMRCTLLSGEGPLPPYEEARYQLNVEAEIHGQSQSQRLQLSPQGGSTYAAYFIPAQAGDYTYVITAKTKDPEDKEITPFRKPVYGVGTFTVKRTVPRLQVGITPTALLPVTVAVRLADAGGADLRVPAEAEPYVQMEVLFMAQGKETVLPLKIGAQGYEGTFTPLLPTRYQARLRGRVQDPTTGDRFVAFDQEIGGLEVLPPRVIWKGFTTPWPQYRSAPVEFSLADQTGQSMAAQVSPTLQLQAEAAVKGPDAVLPVTLAMAEKTTWKGEFIPNNPGEYVLQVSVSTQDAEGSPTALVQDLPLFQFSVRPMTLVRAQIRRPTDGAQHAWRDLLWRPQPFGIEVALTDKSGNLLSPAVILQDPTQAPLAAKIVPPGGGGEQALTLRQGSAAGLFEASFSEYQPFKWYVHRDLGWYDVQITPQARLNEAHTYGAAGIWTARVHLTRHPLWWLAPLIMGLLVGAAFVWAAWRTYLHLWPVIGTLTIEGAGTWMRQLREYGRHTLTFTGRDGLPPNLRKVQVHRGPGSKSIQLSVQTRAGLWALRIPAVFRDYRAPVTGYTISYTVGAGEKPPAGLAPDWKAFVFGLFALGMLAGLCFVIYAVISSLGG